MNQKYKLALFFFFSIILIIGLSAAGNSKTSHTSKVNAQLAHVLEAEGEARVIVMMKDNSANSADSKKAMKMSAMNSVGKEKVRQEYSSFNGFSASLSESEIQQLEADDNVQSIVYDKPVRIDLDQSVPLINATQTWPIQINGINLTGAGQTVCIIDTGIYYQHADLGGCNLSGYNQSTNNESYVFESAHPYVNNYDRIWNITKTGYSQIAVHFKNISLEYPGQYCDGSGCYDSTDRVIIYDSQMKEIARYHSASGGLTDIWTPFSDGNTIYVRLVSDVSVTDYGFYIDSVMNGSTNTTFSWNNCTKVIGGWDFVNNDGNPTDDNGHGTHVAGIVAANGGKKGVAPDAKLVAAKAMDSSGNGYMSNIIAGIEYCINHSSAWNISVISMSLGDTSNFSVYCDANDTLTAAAIDAAFARNISVVVSAGNAGNYTGISSPACMQNAIPVGASTKADALASYSNRNSLVQLFAPGSAIASTWNDGGYLTDTGTSMAAPHVSGAIAVMNEYLRLTGRTKTPQQIESVFNSTGKILADSSSGLNFSRINLYAAITSFKPSLTVVSPQNRNYTTQSVYVNLSTSGAAYTWWGNSSANFSYSSPISVNFSEGSNILYFWANDTLGNLNSSSVTFFVDSIMPSVSFVNPTDNSSSVFGVRNNILVNVSASDIGGGLANITLRLYNSSGLVNSTRSTNANIFLNFTNLNDGYYYFNATACDFAGNCNITETRNISIAINPPIVSISSPSNNTWQSGLRLNITTNQPTSSCWLRINGGANISMTGSSSNAFYYIDTGITESVGKTQNITAYCNNSGGAMGSSSMLVLGFDRTNPTISLGAAPAEGQTYSSSSSTITFYFTPSDLNNLASCILIVDGASVSTFSSPAKSEQTYQTTKSSTTHTWSVNCTDEAGNIGSSSQRSFTVSSTTSSSSTSDSGGAGGGETMTSVVNSTSSTLRSASQTLSTSSSERPAAQTLSSNSENPPILIPYGSKGIAAQVKVGMALAFILQLKDLNHSHTLIVNALSNNSANITIQSNPINFVLKIGEAKRLNVSSSKFYDLYVKLTSISTLDNTATIMIAPIHEPMAKGIWNFIPGYSFVSGVFVLVKNFFAAIFGGIFGFIISYYIWIIVGIIIVALIVVNSVLEYKFLTRNNTKIKTHEFSRYQDYHLPEKYRKKHLHAPKR